jgi:hypothetical protein
MTSTFEPPLLRHEFEEACGRQFLTRRQLADRIGAAIESGTGYAAGKISETERTLLRYPMLLAGGISGLQLTAFEQLLKWQGLRNAGVFPADPSFYREYADVYARCVHELDCIGVGPHALRPSAEIIRFHGFRGEVIRYHDQEPDRSVPADDANCYLPHLEGRRLLLVCPFADALRARANKETFEAVWAKTGKRWFAPAAVEALEFPYGWSKATQERYATSLTLIDDISARIDASDFDVALIAAGGIAIPLAAHVKSLGKVGVSLGGALQPLFGVIGRRWRGSRMWRERYINDAWIDVPAKYRPEPGECDANYW